MRIKFDIYIEVESSIHLTLQINVEIHFIDSTQVFVEGIIEDSQVQFKLRKSELLNTIYNTIKNDSVKLISNFSNKLTFQNYISIKRELGKINSDKIIIDTNEFIY